MRAAASSAVPQPQLYARTYREVTAHVELDEAWSKLRSAIESHAGLLQKQAAVRVRNWVKKLSEETANVVWKKNRNAYARLLLDQLRCGKLAEPFSAQPPGGPLPTLPKHLAYAFKPPRGASSSPAAATQQQADSPGAALAPPPQQQHAHAQAAVAGLNASQQLDEYLGRADFRRAQHADEEQQAVAAAWVPREAVYTGGPAPSSGGAAPPPGYLPGTRMQLRGAEGRRVDRHQLSDVGWQPSKLELEAQLGASRERQAELEWRLGAMETLLRQHAGLLAPAAAAAAAPLGSLLDAIDDGHVSPPRQRARGKQELEALIERYEAKRQQWRSPSWAAQGAPGGSPPKRRAAAPPLEQSEEAEILEQLDRFQHQTETIRRALGGGGAPAWDDADGAGVARKLASSLAGHASDWGVAAESTPLRQHPTGLRGSGHTPQRAAGGGLDLFDGLPPSPAALAATRGHTNRHVQHAGHYSHSEPPPQQPQAAPQPQVPPSAAASSRRSPAAAALAAAELHPRPRSPIGPDVRHTKKSAAAADKAAASASAALQRLKSRRPGSASAAVPQHSPSEQQLTAAAEPLPPQQQQQQQPEPVQQYREAAQGPLDGWPGQQWDQQPLPPSTAPPPAQPAPPAAAQPQLPPDSNAALVAEVRELRARLLNSLQKHAPELAMASGGFGSSSASPAQRQQQAEQRWAANDAASSPGSSWRIAAVSPGLPTVDRSSSMRAAEQRAWPGTAAASSAKFWLTTDDGGPGGGASLSRLSSGGSLGLLGGGATSSGPFSLEAFEAQTEALRRQLEGL